jgi:hypothetical protein
VDVEVERARLVDGEDVPVEAVVVVVTTLAGGREVTIQPVEQDTGVVGDGVDMRLGLALKVRDPCQLGVGPVPPAMGGSPRSK